MTHVDHKTAKQLGTWYTKITISHEKLPADDPRRIFITEIWRSDAPLHYQTHLIDLVFKNILDRRNLFVTDAQAKEWLGVVAYTLREHPATASFDRPHKAVSALFGLYSLQVRSAERPVLIPYTSAMKSYAWHILGKHTDFGPQNYLTWEHALLNPDEGFGPELGEWETFKKNFPEMARKLLEGDKAVFDYIHSIGNSFDSISAHKRVAILAFFYHALNQIKNKSANSPIGMIYMFIDHYYDNLLSHEKKLIEFIRNGH